MVSTIRYTANVSSDHHPNQVPGILIIMNPKQPNLPTCSVTSTYLLFHLLSNPSLHLIANTTLGIIMTAIKISPKTLNHSILSTITNLKLYHHLSFLEEIGLSDIARNIPRHIPTPIPTTLLFKTILQSIAVDIPMYADSFNYTFAFHKLCPPN